MWNQIVAVLAILIALIYIVEQILTRFFHIRLPKRRSTLARDLVPVLVFVGILLFALSFVEAYRRATIESWLIGLGVGVLLTMLILATGVFQQNVSARGTLGILRTYGIVMALVIIGVYLAVRLIGPTAQVLLEGTASIFALGMGLVLFLRGREQPSPANKS